MHYLLKIIKLFSVKSIEETHAEEQNNKKQFRIFIILKLFYSSVVFLAI